MILASKSTSGQKCGFVCYQTRTAQEMAAAAIATLGDRHCPPGVDKPIQVKVAKSSLVSTPSAGAAGRVPFPSGGPLSMPWPDAAYGGLGAAAPSMASPPQPQPPMNLPGAAYGEAAASSMGMPYLQGQACDAATYAAVGPGVGMGAVGMGGMGGAPPWAPSPPQLVPHGHPPHGPSSGERGWLGYEYGMPHGHPTVQENPAGSSDMPVKLFVGTAARSGAPSWRRQSLGRWPATTLHLMSAAAGGSGRLGGWALATGREAAPQTRPLPRVLELIASKVADATAFDHPGSLPGGATTAAVQQIFQPFGQVRITVRVRGRGS